MKTFEEILNIGIDFISEKELVESLAYYNKQYRIGESEIEDFEYDILIDMLKNKYPNSEFFSKSVIDDFNEKRKEKLPIPMFSLDKYRELVDIYNWIVSNAVDKSELLIISNKLDGISLCKYEKNKNTWTRGNGYIGTRCDEHAKMINDSSNTNDFYTYGEVIISKKNWKEQFENKQNPRTNKIYKSSRNTVAGLFNNDTPTPELKHVDYIRYGLVDDRQIDKIEQLKILNSLNNKPFSYDIISVGDFIEKFNDKTLTSYLDSLYKTWSELYQIDGLVIEFNSYDLREKLGRERNNNPKFARAIKLPNWFDIYVTKVKDLIFKVSKNGSVKPVFLIDPVNINGATINKATAYNCNYLINNKITIGSGIEIVRSGDVIPKHIRTLNHVQNELNLLKEKLVYCPSCGNKLHWDDTHTELVCDNIGCKDIRLSKMVHFITTLKIEEFGEKEIENLFNLGYDTYDKLLNIKHSDLVCINGWGDKSANKLLSQFKILKDNEVELPLLLHSLDLFKGKLGTRMCKSIMESYDLTKIFTEDKLSVINELKKIKGVSDITASYFYDGIIEFKNKYFSLPIKFTIDKKEKVILGDKYKGFKVCFTGVRDVNLEKVITEQGGNVVGSVSSNTTHLIVKDYSDKTLSSNKAETAKKNNTKILTIDDFKHI